MNVSQVIIKNLIENHEFTKRVIPFLQDEYFESSHEGVLFRHIKDYVANYNEPPTIEALYIGLTNDNSIPEDTFKGIDETLKEVRQPVKEPSLKWLIDTTEEFCKDRALYNAIYQAISIVEGSNNKLSKGAIPEILQQALAISFDQTIGHDFLEDAQKRFEYYHKLEEKVPVGLEYLDKITKGGFSNKTLNILLAGTHGGKSALMCHMAANNLMDGKNVLYITLEMGEEEIARRVDANLMGVSLDDLQDLPQKMYEDRINKLKLKTTGKLIVKEYPTGSAHVGHLRALMNELLLKRNFVPDIIYVDYINIMSSYRIKPGTNANSYTYNKSISEELRGLGVEMNLPIVTASQFNRGGFANSNPDMEDIAESFGVNFVADFIVALLSNEDLIAQSLMLIKQLKNRYDDKNKIPKFFIGFDRPKMKFYNVADPFEGLHQQTQTDAVSIIKSSNSNSTNSKSRFGKLKT